MTKRDIWKALKKIEEEDGEIRYPLASDYNDVESLLYELENKLKGMNFSVYERQSANGGDYWLQAETYIKKLNKTIIWDYDFRDNFDDEQELIDLVFKTANEIKKFERQLKVIK